MPGVEDRWQTRLGNHLIEHIRFGIIRVELLDRGVKFEASYPELLDQTTGLARSHFPFRRINAGERDKHIGVLSRSLGHIFIRNPDLSRGGLCIDRKNHTGHFALTVVSSNLRKSGRTSLLLKIAPGCLPNLWIARDIGDMSWDMCVCMHIDCDDIDYVHRCFPLSISTRLLTTFFPLLTIQSPYYVII